MFLKKIFIVCALVFATNAKADFMAQILSNYHSREYDGSETTLQEHHLFLGMPVAVKEQLYLGVNVTYTKEEGGTYLNTMEYGPRINYYINNDKTFLLLFAFNVAVSGDKKSASGQTNGDGDVSGSSFLAGLGYEFKVNSNFYLGATLLYHASSLEFKGANADTTDIKYSTLTPSINFCFRFR